MLDLHSPGHAHILKPPGVVTETHEAQCFIPVTHDSSTLIMGAKCNTQVLRSLAS